MWLGDKKKEVEQKAEHRAWDESPDPENVKEMFSEKNILNSQSKKGTFLL